VIRDDNLGERIIAPENHVTALLPAEGETHLGERPDALTPRDAREFAHTATTNVSKRSSGTGRLSVSQTLDARPVRLMARDRLPLTVALLIPEDERETLEVPSSTHSGGHTRHFQLHPARNLQDVLVLSFPQIFERVAVEKVAPPNGRYAAVLVPGSDEGNRRSRWR
jgi:hypothetical protein